jgi:pimeloyl-ACP methyl ester carboxylesterase
MPRPGSNWRLADPPVTIYCHGQPGGAEELDLFGPAVAARCRDWHVLDRSPPGAPIDGWLEARAHDAAGTRPVRLIGFSLGCPVALRLAASLGEQVARVDLVATAAPSPDGRWPKDMAGKPVFDLARDYPPLFTLLAWAQRGIGMVVPGVLVRQLFATAQGEDAALMADVRFRLRMASLLRAGLTRGHRAYRAEVAAFACGSAVAMDRITAPIHCWHGDADNWAPLSLARAWAATMPTLADSHSLAGQSHYSTLHEFLQRQ